MAAESVAEYALCPSFSLGDRLRRQCWTLVWLLFFRTTPRPFHAWRRFVLRCFGAQVGPMSGFDQNVSPECPLNRLEPVTGPSERRALA